MSQAFAANSFVVILERRHLHTLTLVYNRIAVMVNQTLDFSAYAEIPPLPSFTLTQRQPVLPPFSDKFLFVWAPILAYWLYSGFFHLLDTYDLFPQYRLHTPAEILKRNRASRWDVFRDVVLQQIVQVVMGHFLNMLEPDEMTGKQDYELAVWAQRIRLAQRVIPSLLSLLGVNALQLSRNLSATYPALASALAGGHYPLVPSSSSPTSAPGYAPWELLAAKSIYHIAVPVLQFSLAIVIIDTWQYFLHRAMHLNKYLYTTFHSRHHRLYVPYAYGALYNHPFEGFLLDIVGASLAFKLANMSQMQGLCLFVGSTCKTVDDHCGYALPWDPLQHLTGNNAGYHDVHHQTWGIKTNFSQPFFTFWDRVMGTKWVGGDVSARYEKARRAAEKATGKEVAANVTGSLPEEYDDRKVKIQVAGSKRQVIDDGEAGNEDGKSVFAPDGASSGGRGVIAQEAAEEKAVRRGGNLSASSTSVGLKGFGQKVAANTGCFAGGIGSGSS